MRRKWIVALLLSVSLALVGTWYHLFVVRRSEEHFRRLLEAPTVEGKRLHWAEVHRYPHPWNPWTAHAERWLAEEGHEWEFLRPRS